MLYAAQSGSRDVQPMWFNQHYIPGGLSMCLSITFIHCPDLQQHGFWSCFKMMSSINIAYIAPPNAIQLYPTCHNYYGKIAMEISKWTIATQTSSSSSANISTLLLAGFPNLVRSSVWDYNFHRHGQQPNAAHQKGKQH